MLWLLGTCCASLCRKSLRPAEVVLTAVLGMVFPGFLSRVWWMTLCSPPNSCTVFVTKCWEQNWNYLVQISVNEESEASNLGWALTGRGAHWGRGWLCTRNCDPELVELEKHAEALADCALHIVNLSSCS